MRRREIQSFTLKLNDLKEYEEVRQERLENRPQNKTDHSCGLIPKWGSKTKQEIRERVGLKS